MALLHYSMYLIEYKKKTLLMYIGIIFSAVSNLVQFFSHCSKRFCKESRPCVFLFFLLGMNSISRGARFTEPTRENKDALIRNIRGERKSLLL